MPAIELAIDLADLRFLVVLALCLGAGLLAIAVAPWARLERPAGLDDWRRP